MQRASIEAAAALMSSGNSRNTNRTLPVSIYFDRSIGNTFSPNAAQCGQLIDAYSVMVIGAFTDPIAISGSDTGFATAAAIALCATALPVKACAAYARGATARARRRIFNGLLQNDVCERNIQSTSSKLITTSGAPNPRAQKVKWW